MESFKKHLENFPHYTPQVFEEVRSYLSVNELKAGDYFLQEGKVCRNIGFIESGLVRLFYLKDGKEVTHCFCRENTLTTSYRSLITQHESDIAIQAVEPTKLIVLSYFSLQKLYEKNLFWQQVGRLAAESEYVINEAHQRFLQDLTATERYEQIMQNDKELLLRVPLNYLASYLQITPETLSRIRKKISRN